jgi:hypothetical protein
MRDANVDTSVFSPDGVAAQVLIQAVCGAGGRSLDFAKAAADLGITELALRAALPQPT